VVEKYLLLIGLKKQVRRASRGVALGLMWRNCKRNGMCEGEDGLCVLCGHGISLEYTLYYLRELRRPRNSTGWVDGFPLGRGGLVKLDV